VSEMVERDITPERYGPGTFGCHEALDRTSLLMQQVYDLAGHGAILLNAEWTVKALEAADTLYELYQAIGAVHLETSPETGRIQPVAADLTPAEVSDAANSNRFLEPNFGPEAQA